MDERCRSALILMQVRPKRMGNVSPLEHSCIISTMINILKNKLLVWFVCDHSCPSLALYSSLGPLLRKKSLTWLKAWAKQVSSLENCTVIPNAGIPRVPRFTAVVGDGFWLLLRWRAIMGKEQINQSIKSINQSRDSEINIDCRGEL